MSNYNSFIGKQNQIKIIVDENKLAINIKSGDVEVLATPVIISLMEQAANELLKEILPDDMTTVGTMISINHKAPTIKNKTVTVSAKLISIDGKKFVFELSASDEVGEVASGKHERFMVNKLTFIEKAFQRGEK